MSAKASTRDSRGPDLRTPKRRSDRPVQPGRPRDAGIDVAINRAVLDVLHEVGYGGLTYDQVAIRAGVSRPTLYRRAANKASLVVNALVDRYGLAPVPDTGSIEGDLVALQRAQLRLYNDPVIGATLPGLLADIRTNDEARNAWVDGFVRPRRGGVTAAVQRAKLRGELADDTDEDWVCEILTGPLISAAFLTGPRRLPTILTTETVALVISRFKRTRSPEP